MKTLIVIPLLIMFLVTGMSMLGLGSAGTITTEDNFGTDGLANAADMWYDSTGHPVAYANFTAYDDAGRVVPGGQHYGDEWQWVNGSGFGDIYDIFNSSGGTNTASGVAPGWNISSAIGLMGIVVGIMALSLVVGLKIFGSGTDGRSFTIGAGFLALWAVFSVLGLALFVSIPTIGPFAYFGLTLAYTIGILSEISGTGDGL